MSVLQERNRRTGMTKEQELKSLLIRKRTFLIIGIILVSLIIVPVIVVSVHATQYFMELINDGMTAEEFYTHYFELLYHYFEGNLWTLAFTSLVSLFSDIGIVMIVLAFTYFGRKAKKVQRELLSEKIQKEESIE